MHRRHFVRWTAALAAAPAGPTLADGRPRESASHGVRASGIAAARRDWQALEREVGGRLGVALLDTGSGKVEGHRVDERFAMCSTFKWLLAAHVLQRVDAGLERLDRRMVVPGADLLAPSPFSAAHADDPAGVTVTDLCEAVVTLSDNTAANLLIAANGGLAALGAFAGTLGDATTRFDRIEPDCNDAIPGDPRDTTSMRAMTASLAAAALGPTALSSAGRGRLVAWLRAARTGDRRLRADWPAAWQAGDKTGTGGRGSTNDVAIAWPAGRAPIVVAAYLTECPAPLERREQALAQVGRIVRERIAAG